MNNNKNSIIKNGKVLVGGQYFSAESLKKVSKIIKILSIILIIVGLGVLPLGILFIGLGCLLLFVTRGYDEIAKKLEEENNKNEKKTTNDTTITETTNNDKIELAEKNSIKSSNYTFPFIDENMFLKYKYYDIEVKGTSHKNVDFDKIDINKTVTFEEEPTNEYDKNAIKILCNDEFIGYVPKNNLQQMIKKYIDDDNLLIVSHISTLNKETQFIEIAVGFYNKLTKESLKEMDYFETTLIKTNKKDEYDMSRQDNLSLVSEGDVVSLETQYDSDLYVVMDECGNELGEINENNSQKISEYESNNYSMYATIIELRESSSGTMTAKIRIFFMQD